MRKNIGWIAGIFVCALFCIAGTALAQEDTGAVTGEFVIIDDVAPYEGAIGPGSPLYRLKIAFEDLDESFMTNETGRFNMQINTSRLRLSEVRRELLRNNTDAANRALDLYAQKTTMTRLRLQNYSAANATGLLHAQEMILNHQFVLENLLETHPGNQGLMRAYNNSLSLEQKFQEKTQTRFERVMQKNNATMVKAVRLEVREQMNTRNTGLNQTVRIRETQQVVQGAGKGKDDRRGQVQVLTTQTTPGQQEVQTTATTTPVRTTDTKDRGNAGTGNTGNSDGNSGGNSGNGKNR